MQREDRILVVEDDPAIARPIEERFACDRASDGWDAISRLEARDYAAVVIDADLPRQSGFGVLTYLREEIGENLPNVILMTTASDRDDVRRRVGQQLNVIDKADALAEIERVLER